MRATTFKVKKSEPSFVLSTEVCPSFEAWTNFSKQDKTWAEFSTLKVAAQKTCIYVTLKQNSQT
jgi:hypothetical protein